MKFGTQQHILELDDSQMTKWTFLKFKMASDRYFKTCFFLPQLSSRSADVSEILRKEAVFRRITAARCWRVEQFTDFCWF